MGQSLYDKIFGKIDQITYSHSDDIEVRGIEKAAKACERVANQEIKDLLENLSKEFDGCGLEIVGKLLKSRIQELEKKLS